MLHKVAITVGEVTLQVPGEHLIKSHRELRGDAAVVFGIGVRPEARLPCKVSRARDMERIPILPDSRPFGENYRPFSTSTRN